MNSILSLLILLLTFQVMIAKNHQSANRCPDKAEITYPKANKVYPNASDLAIKVNSTACALINSASLFFNGQYIGKKHGPNATWSHTHFKFLRKMPAGQYHVRIHIKEYNGQTYDVELSFRVAGVSLELAKDHKYCVFTNPLKNLTWMRNMSRKNSALQIKEFRQNLVGQKRIVFSIRNCRTRQVAWYDCRGKMIGRGQNPRSTNGLKYVKTWQNGCRY